MLLHVETFHDTSADIVYTKTNCLGTYCLMDMELWLDSLGITAETSSPEKDKYRKINKCMLDFFTILWYNRFAKGLG